VPGFGGSPVRPARVVVKGLDPSLGRPDVVSGTTILGDGRVACILDPVRILKHRVPA